MRYEKEGSMKDVWFWTLLGLLALLLVQDLWVYTQGGDSVIGNLVENFTPAAESPSATTPQDIGGTDISRSSSNAESQKETASHPRVLPGWESVATLERLGGNCDPDTLALIRAFPEYITNFERIDREKDVYFWIYDNPGKGQPLKRLWAQYPARERHIGKLSSLAIWLEEYATPEEARHRTGPPQFKPRESFPTGYPEWTWTIGGGVREFSDEESVYYDAGHLMGTWSIWFASGAKDVYRLQVGVLCFYNYAFVFEYGQFNAVDTYAEVLKRLP